MIDLSIQVRLIVFSLIYGFMFSYLLDIVYQYISRIKKVYQILITFLFVMIMSIIYFIGINKIGYNLFHIYSILCIIIGFISYDIIIKRVANKYKK